jgi:hypothetical protein
MVTNATIYNSSDDKFQEIGMWEILHNASYIHPIQFQRQ